MVAPLVLVARVTVKVNAVEPLLPSALSALSAAMDNCAGSASSLRMVPVALAVATVAPPEAFDSVTAKVSSLSTVVSPATCTVIVFDVSPAAKLTVPLGSTPPAKSAAPAALLPEPATA
ncbi:MAG: hypothetical protein R3F55_07520 [Alphaproteobacteria bacterium]